jgi:hypothetical protein
MRRFGISVLSAAAVAAVARRRRWLLVRCSFRFQSISPVRRLRGSGLDFVEAVRR